LTTLHATLVVGVEAAAVEAVEVTAAVEEETATLGARTIDSTLMRILLPPRGTRHTPMVRVAAPGKKESIQFVVLRILWSHTLYYYYYYYLF